MVAPLSCWIMRRACFALVLLSGPLAASEASSGATVARFESHTHRYGHGIMGDLPEWGRLCLIHVGEQTCTTLPRTRVFEDIAPRLADLDGDGVPEVVVVESSFDAGAALTVYKRDGSALSRIAAPPIGTRNRWLAPAAIADLDGDGAIEIAYIDRPHLAKRLRIWRFLNGTLSHVADAEGLTNHRIGDPFITGGLRDCGSGPEIVTVNANWTQVMGSRLVPDGIKTRAISNDAGAASIARALACQ